jgi:hypothetical protein
MVNGKRKELALLMIIEELGIKKVFCLSYEVTRQG